MPDMKRVRTGCVTCRQRRVKCDERKPTCQRCRGANIYCGGYEKPRHLDSKIQSPVADSRGLPAVLTRHRPDGLPLVGYPDNPTGATGLPHKRARDVLAHHQFTFRTAGLLFKEKNLHFWRNHILQAAWDCELMYDAVIALGSIHQASLYLSRPLERAKGLELKVLALQVYGDALWRASLQCPKSSLPEDIVISFPLLLVYFECFIGNPVAAFLHLRQAKFFFTNAEHELRERKSTSLEPLSSCIKRLELVSQVFLPLPNISFLGEIPTAKSEYPNRASQSLDLYSIISEHKTVTRAITAPLSDAILGLDFLEIKSFQAELLSWRYRMNSIFEECDDEPAMSSIPDHTWDIINALPIPPRPQYFPSVNAAVTAALYNCFMAHTMWLLSIIGSTKTGHSPELSAYLYVYQNIRIAEGLLHNIRDDKVEEDQYFPSEAANIGLLPILYLSAQCCYSATWQQWIVDQLRYIHHEGIFNGEAFATCLDTLRSYQNTPGNNSLSDSQEDVWQSRSPLGPPVSRIIPSLIPDPKGEEFLAYYLQVAESYNDTSNARKLTLEVIGRGSWRIEDSSIPGEVCVDLQTNFVDHERISDLDTGVAVLPISREPVVSGWQPRFENPASHTGSHMPEYIGNCSSPVQAKLSNAA